MSRRNIIAPLDPEKHDRANFCCGVEPVDNFFRKTASKLSKADNLRTWVMTDSDGVVIGFYAMNAHAVDFAELPKSFARTRPGHASIPAAYISMMGVDKRFQGNAYGGDLLVDCLRRIALAADQIGIAVVMLDVLDCGDAEKVQRRQRLFREYGFEALSSDKLRMFLPVATLRKLTERSG